MSSLSTDMAGNSQFFTSLTSSLSSATSSQVLLNRFQACTLPSYPCQPPQSLTPNPARFQSRTFTREQLPGQPLSLANSSDASTSQLHKLLPVSGHPHRRVPWPEMLFPNFLPLHPANPQVLSSCLKSYFSWDFSSDPVVKVPYFQCMGRGFHP